MGPWALDVQFHRSVPLPRCAEPLTKAARCLVVLGVLLLGLRTTAAAEVPAGAPQLRLAQPVVDALVGELQIDVTGSRVRLTAAGQALTFSLAERALSTDTSPDHAVRPARRSAPWLDAALRIHREAPGTPRDLVAVDPEELAYVSATADRLRCRGRDDALRWEADLPAAPRHLIYSGNGRLVVAGLADGSLRWFSARDGHPILTWFAHPDRRRWVAWTPSGYYDASIGGEDLLGWSIPRPAGLPADFFRIGQFRDPYYRPDLISRVLFVQDERRALDELAAESGRPPAAPPVLRELIPPVVTILSPRGGSVVNTNLVTLRVATRSPSGQPITVVRAVARGRDTQGRGVLVQNISVGVVSALAADEQTRTVEVELPPEDVTVVVLAETAKATSEPALLELRYGGKRAGASAPRPDLYVLAIGVSKYQQQRLHLDFAAKDARDMAAAFTAQAGQGYRHVETRVLTDTGATRAAIADGLTWLRRSSTPTDVAVVLLAGHGINDPSSGKYFFLPHEAEPTQTGTLLAGEELQGALGRIAGKVLLFLDSCHAGNLRGPRGVVDLTRLTNQLASAESGVVVFAASSGSQQSQESPRWGNGAFTLAVVEGLRGQADLRGNGRITVSNLESYISDRVRELTHEGQTPTSAKPGTVPDFLVAQVKARYRLERKWWFWGATGLAVAGVVGGALFATRPWEEKPMSFTIR